MPRINPRVLKRILIKAQDEIYELYLKCRNVELSNQLLLKCEQIQVLILKLETIKASH